jgi:excisionase family DNA binding protein
MNIQERRFLHPREFAELFGVSHKHVYSMISEGTLPAVKRKGLGWLIDKYRYEKEIQAELEMRG